MLIDDPTGTPPPEGYPTYDSPVVQAVAAELLGRPYDDAAYWHKPHESNRASALHAAVRAVHAVLSLDSEPAPYLGFDDPRRAVADEAARLAGTTDLWALLADGEHLHRHPSGNTVTHGHPGGEEPHGHAGGEDPRAVRDVVAAELRHTTDTKVRVLRPGSKVGRTLYDAETGELVGMVDSPELAEWLCETVWREVRTQALPEGERPVARELVEQLDERYGLDPSLRAMFDEPIRDERGALPRDEECVNVASAPDRYQLSGVEGVDAVELGILLGSRSLVAVVDMELRRPVAWAHHVHAPAVAHSLSTLHP